MKSYQLEVCCGSVDDVLEAERGGADRVELNSALFLGGLTPSIGALTTAKKLATLPIMAMIRPRQAGFCYTRAEYMTALSDAEEMLSRGADGIVFGFLKEDGSVDTVRTAEMARLAGGRIKVFHRAIDVTPDWKTALASLIDIGIDRVLTSGQAPDAFTGMDTIREMIDFADGRIQILPGGGVRLNNVDRIVGYTGCDQIHLGRSRQAVDPSTSDTGGIHFGGALYPPEDRYGIVDGDYIGEIRKHL